MDRTKNDIEGVSLKRRILIADDEEMMRRLMRVSLDRPDYDIVEACDGHAAMKIIASTPIDLMITDLCMPEQDGLEIIRALRALHSNLKIVAVSGAFNGMFLAPACAFGADAALPKPFRPDQLVTCVEGLLGTPANAPLPSPS